MKKIILPVAALFLAGSIAFAKHEAKTAGPDPIIMTVNGKQVPLSEFEYLYNKNNDQQLQRVTPAEYLDMFINYKLKVADAEAHGLDTTQAFRDELSQHRHELAKPYLRDSLTEEKLIRRVYSHMDRMVDVSHVMLQKGITREQNDSVKARLDSLRNVILSGAATFEQVALDNSIDPAVRRNKGHMGWMGANQYPYTFEDVAYATPKGQISEVMETPFGFHIILVNDVKDNPGSVKARHILKLTRGLSPEQAELKKQQIDSIYEVVKGGDVEVFAAVARTQSEDPGSAQKGGDLKWFGPMQMVPEFEEVAFALKDGEVSKPFLSPFGYHIILREDHRGIPALADVRDNILKMIARDDRRDVARDARIRSFIAENGGGLNNKGMKEVNKALKKFTTVDSAALAKVRSLTGVTVASCGKECTVTAAEVANDMVEAPGFSKKHWLDLFEQKADRMLLERSLELYISSLPEKEPAYRNLINEYRDGILLFDISNTNVWDRANKDTAGLEKYFQANRSRYTWDKPHLKGYLISATSDSVGSLAREFLETSKPPIDSLALDLKNRFGREVKVERVLAAKGDNALIDYLAFEGPEPDMSRNRWKCSFIYDGRLVEQPEEVRDVRGALSADYQQELEQEWVKKLRAKYPVTVNQEVFRQVK